MKASCPYYILLCTRLFSLLLFWLAAAGVCGQTVEQAAAKDTLWLSNSQVASLNPGEPCYVLVDRIGQPSAAATSGGAVPPAPGFIRANGSLSYEYLYRSRVDSPFKQTDFQQHTIRARINARLMERYPVTVHLAYRISNSPYFRNYLDVNLGFDPLSYRQQVHQAILSQVEAGLKKTAGYDRLEAAYRQRLETVATMHRRSIQPEWVQLQEHAIQQVKDSLLAALLPDISPYNRSQAENEILALLHREVPLPVFRQRIREAFGLTPVFVDSVLSARQLLTEQAGAIGDAQQEAAAEAKALYERLQHLNRSIRDSLNQVRSTLAGLQDGNALQQWQKKHLPNRDSLTGSPFLMSLTALRVGRSVADYSYLTVRNVSITGVDIAWKKGLDYRFAAGMIDYRFRDFIYQQAPRSRQPIVIGSVGMTRPDGSGMYFTTYSGKREILSAAAGNRAGPLYTLSGFSLEGKWVLRPGHLLSAELAKSTNPLYRSAGQDHQPLNGLISFRQRSNEAFALQYNGNIRATHTKLQLHYRKFGTDFQSFSVYAFNANQHSWLAQLDQELLHKTVSVKLGVRKNEFVYPQLTDLSSNVVFKTAQLSIHKRKWPTLVAGYHPATQVVVLPGKELSTVTYHTLSGTASHQYRLAGLQSNTVLLYSRFYNTSADSNFLYFNTTYLGLQHLVWLNAFTLQAGYTLSEQSFGRLSTIEGGLAWQHRKGYQLGGGIKGNQLAEASFVCNGHFYLTLPLRSIGTLQGRIDQSYLPAWYERRLIRVTSGQILFTRNF